MSMKLYYDAETDSLYIKLSDTDSRESSEVAPDIVLDFDENGRVTGIDLDHASRHMDLSSFETSGLPFKHIAVR